MFPEILLQSSGGDVSARVSPARGMIGTSLVVGGVELLHLDRATFEDPKKNVRGGIPLLFPFCGKIENETLKVTGTRIAQHGFGRSVPWAVVEQTRSSVYAVFQPSDEVRQLFPFDYTLTQEYIVVPRGLHVELTFENRSSKAIPLSPGWHPYFRCPVDAKPQIAGDFPGTEAGCVHDGAEINFGVVPPAIPRVEFHVPNLGPIRLTFSPEMRHLQIWTLPGNPFVCLEPFHGPPNTINTQRALMVQPGAAHSLWMRIEKL